MKEITFTLCRTSYMPEGTNGILYDEQGMYVCKTIELPWRDNARRLSCIPEGRYGLVKRTSAKFKEHILLTGTEPRDLILIHAANDALKDLAGCIAPVTEWTGPGRGSASRVQLNKVIALVYSAIDDGASVFLEVKANG